MSDYRNPNDPLWRSTSYEPTTRRYNATWGWIAGALFVVIVLAIAFGIGHGPTRTASNNVAPPPPAARLAPPLGANLHPVTPPAAPAPAPSPAPQGIAH